MNADSFTVDTNILLYALEEQEASKHEVALQVLTSLHRGSGVLILQTLGELCNATGRKRPHLRPTAERFALRALKALTVIPAEPKDLPDALAAQQGHGVPFWDAMLWATARRSGCNVLLTEDFQDGRILGGVTFRNPFRMSASELDALALR